MNKILQKILKSQPVDFFLPVYKYNFNKLKNPNGSAVNGFRTPKRSQEGGAGVRPRSRERSPARMSERGT